MNTLSELHNLVVQPKADWYVAYPLFHYLVLAAAYAPYLLHLKSTGGFDAPAPEYPYGFADPVSVMETLAVITRIVALLMSAGVVAATYATGRLLWNGRAGAIASLVVLSSGPMVYYSRTGNLDVPAQFWTALGVLVAVAAVQWGLTTRRAVALGILAALAVATKDQVYGAWLPGLVAVAWAHARRSTGEPGRARWRPLVALFGTAAVTYGLANGIALRPGRFVAHVRFLLGFDEKFFNLQHPNMLSVLRPMTPEGALQLTGDAARAVVEAIGPVLAVLGVLGLILALRRSPGSRLLAALLVGFLLLTLVPVRHMQYRYAMLPAYVLALFAGFAASRIMEAGRGWRRVAVTAVVVGLGVSGARAADLTYQMLRDARYEATTWLEDHARPGDRVAFFGIAHQLPHLPRGVEAVPLMRDPSAADALRAGGIRYVIVAPDYFSDALRERSLFLPTAIYRGLRNGTLGYRRVAHLVTDPLYGRPHPYLPYVNPRVQIFEFVGAGSAEAPR